MNPKKKPVKYTCEICGLKTCRLEGVKRTFMAKFPLDVERCKQWVKVTGNEDLLYIPIEKLHQLKYICGNHFKLKDFKRKKTQLKKKAVPTEGITAEPLNDELLKGFPIRDPVPNASLPATSKCNEKEILGRKPIKEIRVLDCDAAAEPPSTSKFNKNEFAVNNYTVKRKLGENTALINKEPGPSKKEPTSGETQFTNVKYQEILNDTEEYLDDHLLEDEGSPETAPFSWLQKEELVLDADLQPDPVPELRDKNIFKTDKTSVKTEQAIAGEQSPGPAHEGYHCNVCLQQITGFRYVCVECADWDLCSACEARGEHPLHYVLRVPPHRPHSEVRARLRSIRRALADALVHVVPDTDTIQEIKEEEEYLEDPFDVNPSGTANNDANSSDQDSKQDETESNLDDAHSSLNADESIQEVAEYELGVTEKDISLEVDPLQVANVGKLGSPCVQKDNCSNQAVKVYSILKYKPLESSIVQKESHQRLTIVGKEAETSTVRKTPIQSPQGKCFQSLTIRMAPLKTQTISKSLPLKAQFIKKIVTSDGTIVEKAVPIRAQIVRNAPVQKDTSQSAVDKEMEIMRAVVPNMKQPSGAGQLRVQSLPSSSAIAQIKKKITILVDRKTVNPPPGTATIQMKDAVVRMERVSGTAIDEATRAHKRRRLADSHTPPHAGHIKPQAGHTATPQRHSDSEQET